MWRLERRGRVHDVSGEVCWGVELPLLPHLFPYTSEVSTSPFPHTSTHFPTFILTCSLNLSTFSKVWQSYRLTKFLRRSYHVVKFLATIYFTKNFWLVKFENRGCLTVNFFYGSPTVRIALREPKNSCTTTIFKLQ